MVETISSYLYVKHDNEIPVLAIKLLRKISIVSNRNFLTFILHILHTLQVKVAYNYVSLVISNVNVWEFGSQIKKSSGCICQQTDFFNRGNSYKAEKT